MPTITAPSYAESVGVPVQWSQDFSVTPEGLITGSQPEQFVEDLPIAASQTLAALSVVGLDANGRIIPAVAGTTQAIGIMAYAATTDASTTYKVGRVYRSGCFNPDLLAWPASYNTDALKMNAFHGAPSPTQILLRKLASFTPVLP
jgi:hypothetical protein